MRLPRDLSAGDLIKALRSLEHGMDSYIFAPADAPEARLRRFAHEVVPRVREAVARQRGY